MIKMGNNLKSFIYPRMTFAILLICLALNAQHRDRHSGRINKILNYNGTIKQGVRGTFDASGYSLGFTKHGQPLFKKSFSKQQISSTSTWGSLGTGRTGVSTIDCSPGYVAAIAVNADGDIYVGGEFDFAGDVVANNIAKWDGNNWSALIDGNINGVNDAVFVIEVNGADVYVGGSFAELGDGTTTVNYIAKWNEDASTWSSLTGSGINGLNDYVWNIAINGTDVYLGGDFTKLGDGSTRANYIAKWDGTNWSSITSGSGINGVGDYIDVLKVDGNIVYAGGAFTKLGDSSTTANYIAVWDEDTDIWSALDESSVDHLNNEVYDLEISGTDIYVGGEFTAYGSTQANYIAKWNESTGWSTLNDGSITGLDDAVSDIAIIGSNVYVGGYFLQFDDLTTIANCMAKWDESSDTWFAVTDGSINGVGKCCPEVAVLAVNGDELFIGGGFFTLGDSATAANSIALWNNVSNNWSTIGSGDNGVDFPVYSLAINGDDVFVGGYFHSVGGGTVSANYIARWNSNTNTWSALSGGGIDPIFDFYVNSIALSGDNVYVGGFFISLNDGAIDVASIAQWNSSTSTWSALSDGTNNGVNGIIWAVAADGTDIYVGGNFTELSGGSTVNSVAKWDGSDWYSLIDGGVNGVSGSINAIAITNNKVYLGGYFTGANGAENLIVWNSDSETWSSLLDDRGYYVDEVMTISVSGDDVVVGANLYDSGDNLIGNNIARWSVTDNRWNVIEAGGINGFNDQVLSIAVSGSETYIGGYFTEFSDGSTVYGIAKWNGAAWDIVTDGTGNGVNWPVCALAVNSNAGKMFAGGYFTMVGENTVAFGIAEFSDSDNPFPVQITTFDAKLIKSEIQLTWQTATEVNNYGFQVQRKKIKDKSEDDWIDIGFVQGHGTTNSSKEYIFTDDLNLNHNLNLTQIDYRLKQIDNDGTFTYSKVVTVDLSTITDVEDEINYKFALEQNYPNPFNPSTTINFTVPSDARTETQDVRLIVYDVLGKEVVPLVNQKLQPGNREVNFDASRLSSGIYFYRVDIGNEYSSIRKMLFLK